MGAGFVDTGLWPWWAGALGLAAVALLHYLLLGRFLGVSGVWARVLGWREERQAEEAEAMLPDDPAALMAALDAATLEAFGPSDASPPDEPPAAGPPSAEPPTSLRRTPVTAHALFLVMLVVGGLLGASTSGGASARATLGPTFEALFGTGPAAWAVLLFGGVLVGFGTRLGGGCTSGHGLSGCGLFRPASLVGTAAFFGTAVVVSLLLAGVLS
jgi:uncharacterized protein